MNGMKVKGILQKKNTNLEIPYGHCSVNSCSAEFATISFVSFIYRHLAAK